MVNLFHCKTTMYHFEMFKIKAKYKRVLFVFLLIALNLVGVFFVSIVFLGSSNANGEGAPKEAEFIYVLRMFTYVLSVSIIISFIGFLLTRIFKVVLPFDKIYIRRIFWFELAFLVASFIVPFLYIYYLK